MLADPSEWSLRYVQSFTSESILALNMPIPTFDTGDLSDSLLRLRVTSSKASDTWYRAGRIRQIINAGGVDTEVLSKSLRLGDSLLWQLQSLGSYRLRVTFPHYFTQATISIFGYTGLL
jgi:hypothetical protein